MKELYVLFNRGMFIGIFLFFSGYAFGQFGYEVGSNAKADKELLTKKLLVELPDPDPGALKKLQKKADSKPELLKEYTEFFKDYKEMLARVVENHWRLNEDIDFTSTEEVTRLYKEGNKEYAIIRYSEYETTIWRIQKYSQPRIEYGLPRGGGISLRIPFSELRDEDRIMEGDLVLALKIIQNIIEYNIKVDKSYSFESYAEKILTNKHHCDALKGKTIYICKDYAESDVTLEALKKLTDFDIALVDAETFDKVIVEGSPKNAILFSNSNARMIVDAETAEIYYYYFAARENTAKGNQILNLKGITRYLKECK